MFCWFAGVAVGSITPASPISEIFCCSAVPIAACTAKVKVLVEASTGNKRGLQVIQASTLLVLTVTVQVPVPFAVRTPDPVIEQIFESVDVTKVAVEPGGVVMKSFTLTCVPPEAAERFVGKAP